MTTVLTAANEDAGTRLDAFLAARLPELSRSRAASLVQEGRVTVKGRPVSKSCRLSGGETLSVSLPEQPADTALTAQDIPLDVVYEDDDVIVVNKPAGLVVHPAPATRTARW